MKANIKTSSLLILFACAIGFAGCKKNTWIVGTWTQTQITMSTYQNYQLMSHYTNPVTGNSLTLNANGQFIGTANSTSITGTYSLTGNYLTLFTSTNPTGTLDAITTLNDHSLVLQHADSIPGSGGYFTQLTETYTR